MLDIEYFEEEDGKRVLVKLSYDAAKVLLMGLVSTLSQPIPIEADDALITVGDIDNAVQLQISPPLKALRDIVTPASACEKCTTCEWHQGVCGMCGNVGNVGYADCLSLDICSQCCLGLEVHNLLERVN